MRKQIGALHLEGKLYMCSIVHFLSSILSHGQTFMTVFNNNRCVNF